MTDRTNPWLVLSGCFLLSVGVNAFIIAPSSITPLIVEQFGVTTAAAGNTVSAALLGIILTQIPGGYLMDRFDNRWLVAAAVGVFLAVVSGTQVVDSFGVFMVLRFLGGVVAGFAQTTGANVVGKVFAADRQGFATGVYFASPPVAFAFAHGTSPPVALAAGPSRVFLLHGAVAAVGMAVFGYAANEPLRSSGTPTATEFARALGNRAVILTGLSAAAAFALYIFLNTWLPTYGREVLSLPLAVAGVATAAVPLAGIPARPVGGWASTRIENRRRPVLAGALLVGTVTLVAIAMGSGVVLFLGIVVLGGFCLQLGIGLYYTFARELSDTGTEGTSLTLLTTIAFGGSFVAPSAGGWLIATTSWTSAFLAFASLGVLGAVVLLPVPEPMAGTATESDA